MLFRSLAGYLAGSYTIFSASAFASLALLCAIVSGSLPLFTNQIYASLGANKVMMILAVIATVFVRDAEAVVADMAERGESQRDARMVGRITEIYSIKCLPSK